MATKKRGVQGLRAIVTAGMGVVTGTLTSLATQRQALESLRVRVEQLERTARDQSLANIAQQQRLHLDLLSKAMDDPELAEVLDTYEETVSARKQRQFLFANALYTNALCYYRIGNISREEFYGFARGILQNPIFREYWYATRPHRATLIDTSDEAELGRMVDDLLRQLEETDSEEWWVVGEPPAAD
jgi:phospholipase/lecithinase/hemolysin